MSCLAWNYRGLGNLRTRRELVEIVQAKDPAVVFLAETLTDDARLKFVLKSVGFDHRWVVPRVGRGGRLVLYWKASINLMVEGSDRYYIRGVGVVIRDINGAVLASCSEKIIPANKADEIVAALKVLTFAHELGFQNTTLEGDALGLIQALKSPEQNLTPLGLLVEDEKVFANNFSRLSYSNVKRNYNNVAHNLAKYTICIPDFQVWMEDVPSHIVPFLQLDVVDLP